MLAPRDERGFTLIELLIVVIIIGILASAASLSIGLASENRLLRKETKRLVDVAQYAAHTALYSGKRVALQLSANSYRVVRRVGGDWVPFDQANGRFHAHQLAEPLRLSLADGRGGWDDQPARYLAFDPEGTSDAVAIRLRNSIEQDTAVIGISATGEVTVAYPLTEDVSS